MVAKTSLSSYFLNREVPLVSTEHLLGSTFMKGKGRIKTISLFILKEEDFVDSRISLAL